MYQVPVVHVTGMYLSSSCIQFVLVGLNPKEVTNVKPVLAVRVHDVAEKSPWKGREARVPCSRPFGGRKPSRVPSRI